MTQRKADPAMYARVFENGEGAIVLDDLTTRFSGSLFVNRKDGPYLDGRRQTDFNLGRRALLDFILGQINLANDVPPPDDDASQTAS